MPLLLRGKLVGFLVCLIKPATASGHVVTTLEFLEGEISAHRGLRLTVVELSCLQDSLRNAFLSWQDRAGQVGRVCRGLPQLLHPVETLGG